MSGTIGNPTCQGRRLRKWKLYEKNSQREKGVPKIYDKSCHNKSKKFLAKEGVVSFWRLRKFVRTKERKFWQRRARFPFGDSVSKAGKNINMAGIKEATL